MYFRRHLGVIVPAAVLGKHGRSTVAEARGGLAAAVTPGAVAPSTSVAAAGRREKTHVTAVPAADTLRAGQTSIRDANTQGLAKTTHWPGKAAVQRWRGHRRWCSKFAA